MVKPENMSKGEWLDYKSITAIFQRTIEILEDNSKKE